MYESKGQLSPTLSCRMTMEKQNVRSGSAKGGGKEYNQEYYPYARVSLAESSALHIKETFVLRWLIATFNSLLCGESC